MSLSKKIYDVVVVGGGPVGLAFLGALSASDFHTDSKPFLLIDTSKQFPAKFTDNIPSQRVFAVSKTTESLLKSIGAWENLQLERVQSFRQMQVWESHGSGHFVFEDDYLGYIIEYDNLVQALVQGVKEGGKVDIIQPGQLEDYHLNEGEYLSLTLDGHEKQIETKLLVGSDGNKSKVKKISQIGTYGWQYNQMGIVCTVQGNMKNDIAFQRFLMNGLPLALLPLWDNLYSIVWTVAVEDYQYLMKLKDQEFIDEINHALQQPSKQTFNLSLGSQGFVQPPLITKLSNERMSFPLQALQSTRYVADRVALIGDAAHSIHPLAGQGMNLGMNDAILLANCLIKNLKTGNDIGSPQALDDYESQAKIMNYSTSLGIESVKKLYESTGFEPFNLTRNLGASLLNQIDPLKRALSSQANYHVLGAKAFEWNKQSGI